MSADLDKIYDVCVDNGNRLTALETTQKINHKQNQLDMKSLGKTIANVIRLRTHVYFQWFFIGGIFVAIVSLFLKNSL